MVVFKLEFKEGGKLKKHLLISVILLLTACTKSIVLSKPTIPANLVQPCPELNTLDSGDGESILRWGVDTVAKYNECKLRHAKLADVVRS